MKDVSHGKNIFFEWQTILKLNAQLAIPDYKKHIHISDQVLRSYLNSFYVHKLSPLAGRFNQFGYICKEAGLDQTWEQRAIYQLKKSLNISSSNFYEEASEGTSKKLSLGHLVIAFVILLIGYILATFLHIEFFK